MVWKVELAKSAEAELGKFDPQVAWRVSAGNFGDCKLVGDGSFRTAGGYWSRLSRVLRKIRAGADNFIVWGDKGSQQADITRAKAYWANWKRSNS